MTIVRSFQLSDYAPLTSLLQNELSTTCYEETFEAFGRQLSWDSELVLVAVVQHQVVGMIIGTIDNNNGYYYRIAVTSSHQRKGVGRALIQGLKKKFEQRKVSRVLISMDVHNAHIQPFYESLGYRPTDFQNSVKKLSIVVGN
ncbi:MAG: GNAT family N-acetyltransferase [Paenibacillaceae bacterium]